MVYHEITCSAPVNIAVIKYWGKRDETYILPINSSLSVTLHQDHLRTKTTIRADSSFKRDRFFLNGVEENINKTRLQKVLQEMRHRVRRQIQLENSKGRSSLADCCLHIVSENNFPTGAGLASSASGYACLVFALAKLFQLEDSLEELSCIARQGSGSACRSLFGGYVIWEMGIRPDGADSQARSIAPITCWPEMEILVLVVSDNRKPISSTEGMHQSVNTSRLLTHYRAPQAVPERIELMIQAICEQDFATFAHLAIQDSNQFHAICMDTYPPIFYLNDVSRNIIRLVTAYNQYHGQENQPRLGYTFDAGPNAVLFGMRHDIRHIISLIYTILFPPSSSSSHRPLKDIYRGFLSTLSALETSIVVDEDPVLALLMQNSIDLFPTNSLRYMIHTTPGDGPRVLGLECALDDIAREL
jgi:diphosphomevalonate decarboxylase